MDAAQPAALSRAIRWTKSVFLLVLFLSTVTIAYSVFRFLRNAEEKKFNESYQEMESKMYDSIEAFIWQVIRSVDAMIFDAEIQVNTSETTEWPFVAIPHFAKRANKFLKLTGMLQIAMAMFITNEQRQEWESFTEQNNGWVSALLQQQY